MVVSWSNQLSDVIFDDEFNYENINEFGPLIMIEFWEYKCKFYITLEN